MKLILFTLSSISCIKFIPGVEYPDDTTLELADQETLDEFHLQEKEDIPVDQEDLELCQNLDLGDPIAEYEAGEAGSDTSLKQKLDQKCVLKKNKPKDN